MDEIVATKRTAVAAARAARPLEVVQAAAAAAPAPRRFRDAIAAEPRAGMHLIAEIKRKSPSAGLLRPDFDPAQIARIYEAAGASAISVLTDEPYFGGELEHIEIVKAAVGLPVLRKDFIVDPYQVYESRAAGADAILLIGEVLRPDELGELLALAGALHLTALVEVHSEEVLLGLRPLLDPPHAPHALLGINNRDLKVQRVDLATTARLAQLAPAGAVLVSESGVKTRADVLRLQASGARAILVGETLLRAPDPGAKIAELLG